MFIYHGLQDGVYCMIDDGKNPFEGENIETEEKLPRGNGNADQIQSVVDDFESGEE